MVIRDFIAAINRLSDAIFALAGAINAEKVRQQFERESDMPF